MKKQLESYLNVFKQLFLPDQIYESVEFIPEDQLYDQGYRTLFLDIDNTIMPYGQRLPSLQRLSWVKRCMTTGFKVFVVSNNSSHRRIRLVAEEMGATGVYFSCKPLSFAFKDLARRYHLDLKKSVVIGDQIFTDVAAGNWIRAHSILVDPVDKKLSFIKTLQREVELFMINKLT